MLSGFFAGTPFANGQVPVITNPQDLDIVATNEAFDPATNAWTTKLLMPTARDDFAISEVNGKVYVAGGEISFNGCTPIDTLEEYDPATDTWTTKAPMPSPLRWLASAATINGIMYVVGGEGPDGCGAAVKTVAAYDPSNNTWTTGLQDMPTARYFTGTAVIHDSILNRDVLYVIGGSANSGNGIGVPLNTVEAYDPVANSWTTKQPMSTTRSEPVVGVVNGKIYAIGGYDGVTPQGVDTVEEYDPATDSWAPRTSIPVKQLGGRGGVINDIIYVVGGIAVSTVEAAVSTVQTYNPATDQWSTAPNMPSPRTNLGVAIVNNKLYAVGGNNAGIARVGQPLIYQITATNHPTSYSQIGLPPDLSFDTALGIIYGTPTSPSDTFVQFRATNGAGPGPWVTLRVVVQPALNPGEPLIISSTCATGKTNRPFSFQVLTENPTSTAQLTAGGLPPGLSLDSVTGLISGTPTSNGNFGVSLGVTDAGLTTNSTLQLTFISDRTVPIITSSSTAILVPGQFFSRTLTATKANAGFSYIGTDGVENGALPPDLTFQPPATISGTYNPGSAAGRASEIQSAPDTIKIRPRDVVQLFADNSSGTGTAPLNFFEPTAVSRKIHGTAGTFDINLPLAGTPGIECRSGGSNNRYQVVFTFPIAVTLSGAAVTPGPGGTASLAGPPIISSDGTQVTVNLTNVSNVQTITITLSGVNDGTDTYNVAVQMGVLIGDTAPIGFGNGLVDSSDVSLTRSQLGQIITTSNFREDVNVNGSITSSDVSLVRSKLGTSLP